MEGEETSLNRGWKGIWPDFISSQMKSASYTFFFLELKSIYF